MNAYNIAWKKHTDDSFMLKTINEKVKVVICFNPKYPSKWFLYCEQLGIIMKELTSTSLEHAKREALNYCRDIAAETLEEITHAKHFSV